MKPKSIASTVLLVFVVTSVAYLVVNESRSRPGAKEGVQKDGPPQMPAAGAHAESVSVEGNGKEAGHKLIAYYFHRTQRCRTCLAMEAYAEAGLRDGLPDAFESGELEWRAVNVEEPENEHFVEEYGLTASALVMVLLENGEQKQSKNLQRVWELVRDEWGFKDYVRDEALTYLEDGS